MRDYDGSFALGFVQEYGVYFCCSSGRRQTRCELVTGVQTCALPIEGCDLVSRAAHDPRLAVVDDRVLGEDGSPELPVLGVHAPGVASQLLLDLEPAIGRAPCRDRVCQYV